MLEDRQANPAVAGGVSMTSQRPSIVRAFTLVHSSGGRVRLSRSCGRILVHTSRWSHRRAADLARSRSRGHRTVFGGQFSVSISFLPPEVTSMVVEAIAAQVVAAVAALAALACLPVDHHHRWAAPAIRRLVATQAWAHPHQACRLQVDLLATLLQVGLLVTLRRVAGHHRQAATHQATHHPEGHRVATQATHHLEGHHHRATLMDPHRRKALGVTAIRPRVAATLMASHPGALLAQAGQVKEEAGQTSSSHRGLEDIRRRAPIRGIPQAVLLVAMATLRTAAVAIPAIHQQGLAAAATLSSRILQRAALALPLQAQLLRAPCRSTLQEPVRVRRAARVAARQDTRRQRQRRELVPHLACRQVLGPRARLPVAIRRPVRTRHLVRIHHLALTHRTVGLEAAIHHRPEAILRHRQLVISDLMEPMVPPLHNRRLSSHRHRLHSSGSAPGGGRGQDHRGRGHADEEGREEHC
mmetsp:Transcript_47620/g.121019  ORF Transcript_47620/g.121019 Transcript_47620/m.121019 type:complete len:470 (-) Transcript_47620:229-1638(-)